MPTYRNVDVELFGYQTIDTVQQFRVRVIYSPAGEQHIDDADVVEIKSKDDLESRLRQLERRQLSLQQMIDLGEKLSRYLFPPKVRSFYERSRAALRNDERLRIRLKIESYELASIPWEYVYIAPPNTPANQKGINGFLVLDRRISLARYEVLQDSVMECSPMNTPIKMAVILSNPEGTDNLHLDVEQRNLERVLSNQNNIQPSYYPRATLDDLEQAVGDGIQVFHFAGHGTFEGSTERQGALLLHNDDGTKHVFGVDHLALLLQGRGIRLAILGACHSGKRDRVNVWSGIAPALVRAGIPAVIGMQYTIQDTHAIAFSNRLYEKLLHGESIDAAITEGRLRIVNRDNSNDKRDFGVPVLYLRSGDGILFPKQDQPTSQATPAGQTPSPQPETPSTPQPQPDPQPTLPQPDPSQSSPLTAQQFEELAAKLRDYRYAKDIHRLADTLLECPSVKDKDKRNKILEQLPPRIANTIDRNNNNRVDVINIVKTCVNYPQGLGQLIEQVRSYDEGTVQMQAVDALLQQLYASPGASSTAGEHSQGSVQPSPSRSGNTIIQGDQINAQGSQGFINRPTAPITQHFGDIIHGNKISGDIHAEKVSGSGIAIGHQAQAQAQVQGNQQPIFTGSSDPFAKYERGVRVLLERLGESHPNYSDALVHQQRLQENISLTRRYSDNEARRSERIEIIDRLNALTLATLGISFNKLSEM